MSQNDAASIGGVGGEVVGFVAARGFVAAPLTPPALADFDMDWACVSGPYAFSDWCVCVEGRDGQ